MALIQVTESHRDLNLVRFVSGSKLELMKILLIEPNLLFDEEYIHQFQLGSTHIMHHVKRYHPTEHHSNDHKDHPCHHENSHKLCNEKWHPLMSLKESQWKLRQHD